MWLVYHEFQQYMQISHVLLHFDFVSYPLCSRLCTVYIINHTKCWSALFLLNVSSLKVTVAQFCAVTFPSV